MRNKICHKESPQWSASRREWSVNHIEREDSDKAGCRTGTPAPRSHCLLEAGKPAKAASKRISAPEPR